MHWLTTVAVGQVFTLPLIVGNTGTKAYVNKINIELYLRDGIEANFIDMRPSGFTLTRASAALKGELVHVYSRTLDVVSVPRQPHMFPIDISLSALPPQGSGLRMFWRIQSGDGTFPSDTEVGEFDVMTP